MARKVFFAWQSDAPNKTNRGLIRSALEKAASAATIEDADRDQDWFVDQDTQGIPGSPDIGQAILDKISEADAFVADLTLVDGSRPAPNPNVLVEYGYALRALGPDRIIGVMNTAHGKPEQLPFDIRGKRCITYRYDPQDKTGPSAVRNSLAKRLEAALTAIADTQPVGNLAEDDTELVAPYSGESASRFPVSQLGTVPSTISDREDSADELKVWPAWKNLGDSFAFMRLNPTKSAQPLTPISAREVIQKEALQPLFGYRAGGHFFTSRNREGAAAFYVDPATAERDSVLATTAVEVFKNREIWSVDTWLLDKEGRTERSGKKPFIPPNVLQEGYLLALAQYLRFARGTLNLDPPLRWVCGLVRIEAFRLLTDYETLSEIPYETEVITTGLIKDFTTPVHITLRPFFESVWEEFGLLLGTDYDKKWSDAKGFDLE